MKYYIGIDEVGRGPIAGPVTVCALLSKIGRLPEEFRGIKDSKKLTEKGREKWFKKIKEGRDADLFKFSVISVSNKVIDNIGIVRAIELCIKKCLDKFYLEALPPSEEFDRDNTFVLLDGSLKAPSNFKNQETIIRGDEKEPLIAMASIVAKISRDWYMTTQATKEFPQYGFENHKGYGTKAHYEAIKEYGLCELHRRSFLR
jgi:ribonuclease HII